MVDVRNKKISVIGAASSGMAVAKLLQRHGARVFVSELSPAEQKTKEAEVLKNANIDCEFGQHSDRVLDCDFAVVSPGVPGTIPILKKLAAQSISVYSELEMAAQMLQSPVIAITGSNGKTTTTTLIGEIFRHAKKPTLVAGNIGTPLSDVVESSSPNGWTVLEVSSFQAERMKEFKPKIGLLLNLSPDHMDRYPSVNEYYQAKRKMFVRQTHDDSLIYNDDDAEVVKLIEGLSSKKYPFSLKKELNEGAYVHNQKVICRIENRSEEIINASEIAIRGRHNLYNSLAAVLAARLSEVDGAVIRETLRDFKGVEHRLEFVRELNGVKFYNDSKATNVDSTFFALESFEKEKIILIAGGKHKGAPYTPLKNVVQQKVNALVLIGQAANLIEQELNGATKIIRAGSMKDAVKKSFELAQSGDVVLLSPACSSFDMFKNYEDRGSQYRDAVRTL
jgi:UDP-N-acetylmuramoylalanine--D-glutamate ligase